MDGRKARRDFIMGVFILIAFSIAILVIGLALPTLAKIFVHLDYVLLLFIIWGFVFGASGHNEYGFFTDHSAIHPVFVILIYLSALGAWFGLQQIRIFNIYILRIAACALSAYFLVYIASAGWFGETKRAAWI